jgi:hypothetical protein
VVGALREGADVNGRFSDGDAKLFQDRWSLGWPVAAKKWTPLIALASASEYPDPPRKVQNTEADLDWAREQKAKVPREQIEQRKRDALTIALILLSHRADIDADDGFGATALYEAVYLKKLELAKLLLRFNAKVIRRRAFTSTAAETLRRYMKRTGLRSSRSSCWRRAQTRTQRTREVKRRAIGRDCRMIRRSNGCISHGSRREGAGRPIGF